MSVPQCPCGQAVIRRRFWIEADWTQDPVHMRATLVVQQDWICISASDARTATDAAFDISDSRADQSRKFNEAVATYLTDSVTNPVFKTQFWSSSSTFPIAQAAQVITNVNDALDKAFTDRIQGLTVAMGGPYTVANAASGITSALVLEPIAEPLNRISMVLEVVGLAVGLLTGQVALVVTCSKALAHDGIKSIVNQSIRSIIAGATGEAAPSVTDHRSTDLRDAVSDQEVTEEVTPTNAPDWLIRVREILEPTRNAKSAPTRNPGPTNKNPPAAGGMTAL